ncbi:MAG: Phosphotransferase enzyme family protein [bacterium ADurb.Bin212]|nr:MAG: Phosphotransferase enzyme family protein [bacterium ADurb.Bin212]
MNEGLHLRLEEEIEAKKLEEESKERNIETEEALETLCDGLKNNGLIPVKLIQGGVDGIQNPYDRPFMVVETACSESPNEKRIFKSRTRQDPDEEGLREIQFLETLAPYFCHQLPTDLSSKVVFPNIHDAKTSGWSTYCVQDYLDGSVAGWRSGANPDVISESHLRTLVELTKSFHGILTQDVAAGLVPGLSMERDNNLYDEYKGYVDWQESPLPSIIGEGNMHKMRQDLEKYEELLQSTPREFSAGDINPGNIIITPDNKIGWIDWERVGVVQGPANDYAFMLADLWSSPGLQRSYKNMAVEANRDIKYFEDYLRLAFLYQYSASAVVDFSNMLNDPDLSTRQTAQSSLEQIAPTIIDAINQRGIWYRN